MLFVDDDTALARMFAAYFSKKGYPVDTAADGVEAVQKMLLTQFEMVIADRTRAARRPGLLRVRGRCAHQGDGWVALFSCHDDYREALRAVHAGSAGVLLQVLRTKCVELQV